MKNERIVWNANGDFYEGEIKNGEPHGVGAMYSNHQLIYKGQFEEGIIHGFGTEYAEEGYIVYEGQFVYDSYCGEGVKYYPNGQIKRQGLFQGHALIQGKVFTEEGKLIKEGRFYKKQLHGVGQLHCEQFVCSGIFYQDVLIGICGELQDNLFLNTLGDWIDGKQIRLQMNNYTAVLRFAGERQHGETELYDEAGDLIAVLLFEQGQFVYEKRYEQGRLVLEGAVRDGYLNGLGKLYNAQGQLVYEGALVNGERHGEGTSTLAGGRTLVATYENNIQIGEGRLYEADGRLVYEGVLFDEYIDGEGTYYYEDGSYFVGEMYFRMPLKGYYYSRDGQVTGQENRQITDLNLFSPRN